MTDQEIRAAALREAVVALLSYPVGHTEQCRYLLYAELCDCGLQRAQDRARTLIADAVAYGAGGVTDPERPNARKFRDGECDKGDLVQRALACIKGRQLERGE